MNFSFFVEFSGIRLGFDLPNPITLPRHFAPLQVENAQNLHGRYRVQLLTQPLQCPTTPVHIHGDTYIYQTDKGWLHVYSTLGDEDGCQVACLFCPNGQHTLYYPASRWEEYSKIWNCTHLIQGERMLLRQDAFLLHSSLVRIHGKAVLFSGPSGAGKSTQAQLWNTHLGAEILNGDRTVVMQKPDGFYGGGSIWSGTSHIYRRSQAPIAGIFLVDKAPENRVERLGFSAFKPLFTQTIVNSWDPEFMKKVTDLFGNLLEQVPIYRLYCRPDQEAAELAHDTLFGKETT